MIKKTITYEDYNGVTRTEDFYFNLNQAELTEMELGVDGGLTSFILKMAQKQKIPTMIDLVKKLILKSYGEKSDDGRRFIKSEELSKEFEQTEAFSSLYVELISDSDATLAFMKGILPAKLAEKFNTEDAIKAAKEAGITIPENI